MENKANKLLVFGGSGAVGTGIIAAVAKSEKYSSVTLVLRRRINLPVGKEFEKFDQVLVNFDRIEDFDHLFSNGYSAAFYALGVSSIKVSDQIHREVEVELCQRIMLLIKKAGIPEVHLMSSMFTSPTSWLHHLRVKAEVEENVSKIGFSRLCLYRMGGVLTPDYRGMLHPLQQFFAYYTDPFRWGNLPAEVIGRAMLNNSLSTTSKKAGPEVNIYELSDIKRLANY